MITVNVPALIVAMIIIYKVERESRRLNVENSRLYQRGFRLFLMTFAAFGLYVLFSQ